MFEKIKGILWRLFGRKTIVPDIEIAAQDQFGRDYEQAQDINFTAVFANKLASLIVTESLVTADGKNPRAEFIDGCISDVWDQAKKITARALGTGGVVLIPYAAGGKIFTDIVPQDRFYINDVCGRNIRAASVLADVIVRDGKRYARYTDYMLENGVYIIRNRAECEGKRIPLEFIQEWKQMQEEIRIANVDKMLFAHLKCPVDNRRAHDFYGVPITYGCGKIIADIRECMEQIRDEFAQKQVRVFADEALFGNSEAIEGTLFKRFMVGGSLENGPFLEVFDPAIRESSYYTRLTHLFELLEKAVGVSRGILTEQVTQGATATEIKRASYDTFALVENMRKNWEKAAQELAYAYNVLAEFYGITPPGDFTIRWDWSYALIESSTESWQELVTGVQLGIIRKEELRQFIRPNESIAEAKKAIREINKQDMEAAAQNPASAKTGKTQEAESEKNTAGITEVTAMGGLK